MHNISFLNLLISYRLTGIGSCKNGMILIVLHNKPIVHEDFFQDKQ